MTDRRQMPVPEPRSKTPEDCTHTGFSCQCEVDRLEDSGKYALGVRVTCIECGSPFRFVGLAAGLRFDGPTVSIDELELRAPIEPEGEKRLQDRATFQMPVIPQRH